MDSVSTQPKKKEEKKFREERINPDDVPLDDPVLEKLRQQK